MKKKRLQKLDKKGYSLIEVLVAFMILILASQILLLGISFTKKMDLRTNQIETMRREVGRSFYEESSVISGTLRMKLENGEILEKPGFLYAGDETERIVPVKYLWTEEPEWKEDLGE